MLIPSLDEALRAIGFIVTEALRPIAARVASGTPTADALRDVLALTITVVGATERLYQQLGTPYSEEWESLGRSAMTFMDEYVPHEPLALAGKIVGLLCALEFLLALFPSNKVAAFCVQLASLTATAVQAG